MRASQTKLAYHRVMIDVDLAGNPIGVSVESYVDTDRIHLVVLERPGPFDTVDDCLNAGMTYIGFYFGKQLTLY